MESFGVYEGSSLVGDAYLPASLESLGLYNHCSKGDGIGLGGFEGRQYMCWEGRTWQDILDRAFSPLSCKCI